MDHFKILKRAWDIVWHYRALWLIGLVLVLVGGAVGSGFRGSPGGGAPGGGGSRHTSNNGPVFDQPHDQDWTAAKEKVLPVIMIILIIIAVLFVLAVSLGIVKLILRYVTRTSLIEMVDRYEESGEQVGFWQGIRLGWSKSALGLFVTRLLLGLPPFLFSLASMLIGLTGALIIIVVIVGTAKSGGTGAVAAVVFGIIAVLVGMAIVIPLSLIAIALRIITSLISEIAFRVCVLEKSNAWESIKEAWALIRRNLLAVALQALLVFGLGIAWNIALFIVNLPLMMLALLVAGLPAAGIGTLAALLFGTPLVGVIVGLLIFIPVMIIVMGLPNTLFATLATIYYSTVWTLTYRELRLIDNGDLETELVQVKAAPQG